MQIGDNLHEMSNPVVVVFFFFLFFFLFFCFFLGGGGAGAGGGGNKKNIINLSSAENAQRVVKVNYRQSSLCIIVLDCKFHTLNGRNGETRFITFVNVPVVSQRVHDVYTTSNQCRYDVMTFIQRLFNIWRCMNVDATLYKRLAAVGL